jgi:ArsR family transcriptional regulator, repressor of sdpIR and other operons
VQGVFEALAHPNRRRILALLRDQELTAGAIAERLQIPAPTLSGHLNVLKSAGLIEGERSGTSISYRLNATVAEQTITALLELLRVGERRHERDARERLA